MRIVLLAMGWSMVAIGVVGVFLPVLPTTPFMILAAAIFARSSPRFEQWLLDHPRYGKPLLDWRRQGAISRPAKIASVSLMSVSYIIIWLAGPSMLWLKVSLGFVLLACAVFVLTRPRPTA